MKYIEVTNVSLFPDSIIGAIAQEVESNCTYLICIHDPQVEMEFFFDQDCMPQ